MNVAVPVSRVCPHDCRDLVCPEPEYPTPPWPKRKPRQLTASQCFLFMLYVFTIFASYTRVRSVLRATKKDMIPLSYHYRTAQLLILFGSLVGCLLDLSYTSLGRVLHAYSKGYVMRKAHAYTKSIRTINVTCIATRLGRDFSLLIFLSRAHKNVHNFKTAHASTFKLARIVQKSATCSLSNLRCLQLP